MIFAQLAVLTVVVFHHGKTLLAHLRIDNGVLRKAHVPFHAEGELGVAHALGDGSAQRIVGIEGERRRRSFLQRADDAVLNAVDFAHAVQLVAEQVQKHNQTRLELGGRTRKPQLVAFDHRNVGGLRMQQRGSNARAQVRSSAVANDAFPRGLQSISQQVGHRGLAVGAHHDDRPFARFVGKMRDDLRVDAHRKFAGKGARRSLEHVPQAPCGQPGNRFRAGQSCAHVFHLFFPPSAAAALFQSK